MEAGKGADVIFLPKVLELSIYKPYRFLWHARGGPLDASGCHSVYGANTACLNT